MRSDDTTRPPSPSSRAIEVFSNFLTSVESGSTANFEELLAHHPDIAGELRTLFVGGSDPAGGARPDASRKLLNLLKERAGQSHRFLIRGELGRGAMGVIYRVFDRDLRRHLAMKVLRSRHDERDPAHSSESENLRWMRFLDEAQITSQLDHASIVPVHDLGMDEKGHLFFLMKLVRGRDLKSVFDSLQKGEDGWTRRRAVAVLQRVCEAIGFAHAKGVIHRDLKPSNIMVGPFGEVYVMDWGLARSLDRRDLHDIRLRTDTTDDVSTIQSVRRDNREGDSEAPLLTMDGSVIGTPAYMPPEQANGRLEQIGPASDVYSIGAMLYHSLCGHMPYVPPGTRISQYTLLNLVMHGPPPPIRELNPEVPEELAAICEKAMARDATQRYASATDMGADLEAWLERRPVAAQPPSLWYSLKLMIERNRKVCATIAGAAALLIMTTLWFLLHLAGERDKTARLADASLATALLASEDALTPLLPESIDSTRQWLDRSGELLQKKAAFDAIFADAPPLRAADIAKLKSELQQLELLRPKIAAKFEVASRLTEETVNLQKSAWDAAVEHVAKSNKYGGLKIRPVAGWIPLGADPVSGLYQFWSPISGEKPQLDPTTGRLLNQKAGIVMLLIPGGEFTIGSNENEEGHQQFEDPAPRKVAPFFISKFEITQAQWICILGSNPSEYAAGTSWLGQSFTEAHPVESVTWNDCIRFVTKAGVRLPTETEWEYACRAGTTTAYPWGDSYECLNGRENILDARHTMAEDRKAPWADDYLYHAPAGSFAPNGFGLFDMLGNVAEWCGDTFQENYNSNGANTHFGKHKVLRGGSWYLNPAQHLCRSAFRQYGLPATANKTIGLRVAKSLEN